MGEFAAIGSVANHDFSYARYDLKPMGDDAHSYRRVVIFEGAPPATLRPILISGDDPAFDYERPEMLRSAGHVLLHIPASESGTGNFNRESLYVWANDGWHDVDATSWLDDLRRRLPKGRAVWKGVYPDWKKMTADTPLWRQDSDGNCCPTGGSAHLTLALRSDRIVLMGLRVSDKTRY